MRKGVYVYVCICVLTPGIILLLLLAAYVTTLVLCCVSSLHLRVCAGSVTSTVGLVLHCPLFSIAVLPMARLSREPSMDAPAAEALFTEGGASDCGSAGLNGALGILDGGSRTRTFSVEFGLCRVSGFARALANSWLRV